MIKLPLKRERLLVIAAGGCLALLLLDHFLLTPFFAAWRARSETIHELRAKIAQGTALVDQEPRWLKWRDDYNARLLSAVPADAESKLLNQVDGWARQAGLRLTSLRPRWKEGGKDRSMLELQVTGNGSMDAVVRFLFSLETAPLAVAVEQLEMMSGRQDSTELALDLRLSGLCQPSANRGGKP